MTTQYTILEQLELDFENASFDKKCEILSNALDSLDSNDPEVKETIMKLKNELSDVKEQMDIEQDTQCNKDIESGKLELYKCIKEVGEYILNQSYYVKIDDVKSIYNTNQVTEMSDEVKNYISNIKPIIWVYRDNGIGTLKSKSVFPLNFSEYFEKTN